MTTLFLICAVAGGTLFVCQLVMMLLGIGGHHDFHVGHGIDASVDPGDTDTSGHEAHIDGMGLIWSLLSFRPIITGTTIFGLAGIGALQAELSRPIALLIAAASGLAGASLVAWMLRLLIGLQDDGTTHIEKARGATGTVYISIPADSAGMGKVQLELQNRTVEVQAVTPKSALQTGTKVVVVDVLNPQTVEVIAVPQRS